MQVAIGSPPQLVYSAIDLFTNKLWVDPDCFASISYKACFENGNYDPNVSATAGSEDCDLSWGFSTSYGYASGCSVLDEVQFAGTLNFLFPFLFIEVILILKPRC